MRDLFVTLLILGSVPVILVKPHIGVLVWSWISYMNPHRLTWGFAYEFRFALVIALVTVFAWLFSREPKRLPWHPLTALLAVFAAWVSLTTLFAQFPEFAQAKWEQTIKILLINGFVTLGLIRTRQQLDALIWVIVLSLGFYGVKGGIYTILGGGEFLIYGPAGSFIASNNYLALALLMTLPLMRYIQLTTRFMTVKIFMFFVIFFSVIAVFGTSSRGGFVGLIILFTLFVAVSRVRILFSIIIAAILVFGLTLMPERWHDRMSTIKTYETDLSVQGRIRAWNYALDTAAEHPILGGGFEVFRGHTSEESERYRNAHSIYFEVLGEHGYVGLALFLLIGVVAVLSARSVVRRARGHDELKWARDLASMCQVSILIYAIIGSISNAAFFDIAYHIVVFIVIVSKITEQEEAKSGQVEAAGVKSLKPLHHG